ncbi:MAG: 3-deoxy-manno-octulosonate cytidylyltransferase, partial [Oxalobacteraceae bacterium]
LYFSKGLIPHLRQPNQPEAPFWRHIGLYAFRKEALARYAQLPSTPLERAEQLEQLRALEHGMAVHVVPVDYRGRTHWSVDYPEDLETARDIILREGELIS